MFNNKTNLQRLQQKSQNIVDVFTKTKLDLKDVNDQITEEKKKIGEELARLMKEQDDLVKMEESNERIIANIDKFFE